MSNPKTLAELGDQRSLLGSRFIGLMRTLGATGAAVTAAGAAGFALAYMEARSPVVRHYDVPVPARPGLKPFRILHLSDLHMFSRQGFISDLLHRVAQQESFDFVVSTGDNLGEAEAAPMLMDALEPLLKWPGAFVLGSNDYYSPKAKPWVAYLDPDHHSLAAKKTRVNTPDLPWVQVVRSLTKAGWLDLTNQGAEQAVAVTDPGHWGNLVQPVAMLGVDDPHIKRDREPEPPPHWGDPGYLRLALTHAPYRRTLDFFTSQNADLILAGHTHGGQVRMPFLGAVVNNTDIPRRYSRGLYRWDSGENSSALHISAGLGTSPYAPIRLFCRPEVSIIRVCPTD